MPRGWDGKTMTRRELRSAVKHFRDGLLEDLTGGDSSMMCFAVCAPLQGWLAFLGVETRMIEGDFGRVNHVWLEMDDGTIIDPTADQFSTPERPMPKIYIGSKPKWYEGKPR